MVFRLPTHLESFIPPPSHQVPLPRPWRGTFVVDGTTEGTSQEIRVTAVELDGDSRVDLWPPQLYIYTTHEMSTLSDFLAWVKRHAPPICTFMPDRIDESHPIGTNQNNFALLSRILLLNQMVAVAPWAASDRLPGAGVVLFPCRNSNNLLFGAILLTSQFPDFIVGSPTASMAPLPATISHRQPTYTQSPYPHHMGYSASHASTTHHITSSNQPPSSPGPSYAYTIPRLVPASSLSSSSMAGPSSWSIITDPDDDVF